MNWKVLLLGVKMFGLGRECAARRDKSLPLCPLARPYFPFSNNTLEMKSCFFLISLAASEKRKKSMVNLRLSTVEKDKDFSHQRRHYKEFRFDLTQIPDGEAVTAAEFRIYKDRSPSRFDNVTLKVSVYQVIKEYPNKWVAEQLKTTMRRVTLKGACFRSIKISTSRISSLLKR